MHSYLRAAWTSPLAPPHCAVCVPGRYPLLCALSSCQTQTAGERANAISEWKPVCRDRARAPHPREHTRTTRTWTRTTGQAGAAFSALTLSAAQKKCTTTWQLRSTHPQYAQAKQSTPMMASHNSALLSVSAKKG